VIDFGDDPFVVDVFGVVVVVDDDDFVNEENRL
jgi:hypothetical protein